MSLMDLLLSFVLNTVSCLISILVFLFFVTNLITIIFPVNMMKELKFTGNCLKGSRPVLCFDKVIQDLQSIL